MKNNNVPTRRSEVINIRFMPQDISRLQKLAEKKGIPLSTYCYLIIKNTIDHEASLIS